MTLANIISNPGALRFYRTSLHDHSLSPIAPRIVEKQTTQRRSWHSAFSNRQQKPQLNQKHPYEYQRYCRRKRSQPRPFYKDQGSWWSWYWNGSKSSPEQLRNRNRNTEKDFWDAHKQTQERFERIKRQIEEDPYTALFGKRHGPLFSWEGHRGIWESFWRSLGIGHGYGHGKDGKDTVDTTARSAKNSDTSSSLRNNEKTANTGYTAESLFQAEKVTAVDTGLEYDPISGRMVPRKSNADLNVQHKEGENSPNTSERTVPEKTEKSGQKSYNSSKNFTEILSQPEGSKDVQAEEPRFSKAQDDAKKPTQKANDKTSLSTKAESRTILENNNGFLSPTSAAPSKPDEKTISDSKQHLDDLANQEKSEDLDLLRASDIRASYDLRKPNDSNLQNQKCAELEEVYEVYESVDHIDAESIRAKYQHQDISNSAGPEKLTEPLDVESPAQSQLTNANLTNPLRGIQSPEPPTETAHKSSSPFTYRVLAYDPSTLQMNKAETVSTLGTDKVHPDEILARLNNPAKFLPYFEQMQKDGFEISAGGGDILVFRRSKETESSQNAGSENLAGFPAESIAKTPKSGILRALRRMLFAGVTTAATCYAIGVVVEYFRTGGVDGWGIDAFTEFESERRHRDA